MNLSQRSLELTCRIIWNGAMANRPNDPYYYDDWSSAARQYHTIGLLLMGEPDCANAHALVKWLHDSALAMAHYEPTRTEKAA